MYPVLIGSRALHEYGIVPSFNDIDIVVDKNLAGGLALSCDKKDGNMIWFGTTKVDLHLAIEGSNMTLFTVCNNAFSDNNPNIKCTRLTLSFGDVIVPPLEILYVILKSHIHCIVPVTSNQDQNISIWFKHMDQYHKIRNQLGYKRLDDVLYMEYLGKWCANKKRDDATRLEHFMKKIYFGRFQETNERIGDTVVSMEKSETEFFNDNVKRFVDHDQLHSEVGMALRDNADPIFKKYQKDSSKVSLDRDAFLAATDSERIDMLREEIIVLLLERKWIPEVMECFVKTKLPYDNYDVNVNALSNS